MTAWADNDALFRSELEASQPYTDAVCTALNAAGIPARTTRTTFRPTYADRGRYRNEPDIVLPDGRTIEAKSRRERFTTAADYPYPTAFVDTVSGWRNKARKPIAVVLVSRPTAAMLYLDPHEARTSGLWEIHRRRDRVRDIVDDFLAVHVQLLRPLTDLIHRLSV